MPCSALALEALNDFIHPGWPVGDNDYTDANHVMIMRAFERALVNPKVNKSLASVLRLMRVEPKCAAAEWGKKLANLAPLQNKASIEQLEMAAKDAIRPGPTKRNRKRFLVCLAFSYLYERDGGIPNSRSLNGSESGGGLSPRWFVDAHGYGKRFVVRTDEKLTAFMELEGGDSVFAGGPKIDHRGTECDVHGLITKLEIRSTGE